jgi:hypothetical protein
MNEEIKKTQEEKTELNPAWVCAIDAARKNDIANATANASTCLYQSGRASR